MIFLKRLSVTVFFLFGMTFFVLGQNNNSVNKSIDSTENKINNLIKICEEVKNTYRVITSNTRLSVALKSDVCEIVNRERKKSETVFYKYDEFTTLEIFSEDQISKRLNK